jgi:hypothetical protein
VAYRAGRWRLMNFLEICTELASKAGIPSSNLTDVSTATGELGRVVSWAREAYRDIQQFLGGEWRYLHTEYKRNTRATITLDAAAAVDNGGGTVTLPATGHVNVAGDEIYVVGTDNYDGTHTLAAGTTTNELHITATYTAETFAGSERVVVRDYEFYTTDGIANFDEDSYEYFLKTDGENAASKLVFVSYKTFKEKYRDYSSSDRPSVVTVTPKNRLRVYPAPDNIYSIIAEAFYAPQILTTNDGATLLLPAQYHMIVVWKALIDYGGYEETGQVMTFAGLRYKELWDQITDKEKYQREPIVVRPM